jgi:hypothetical protein
VALRADEATGKWVGALHDMWLSDDCPALEQSIEKDFCFSVNLFNPKEFIF